VANVSVFESGYNEGAQVMAERNARKQALADKAHDAKIKDLIDKRSALVTKLPALLDESGKPTPAYNDTFNSLKQVNIDLIEAYDPTKHAGAIERLGHLLTDHLGLTSAEKRQDKQAAKTAQRGQVAETQAQLDVAAAPLSPEQAATTKARAEAAANLITFQNSVKLWDSQNPHATAPDATPEEKQSRQDYINSLLQGPMTKAQNYKPDVQSLTLSDGTQVSAQWTPNPSLPSKGKWQYLNGEDIEPSLLSGAKITPKPTVKKGLKYEPTTGEVLDQDTGKRYSISDIANGNVPPDVLKMFNDAKFTMDDKQKKALQLATTRMAALGASRIVTPINPENPSQEIYATAGEAAKKHMLAPGSIEYKMALPTASERQRADFALSAHEQLETMKGILANRPDLFGPLSGRYTNFTEWVGSQDPDAQRFRIAAQITSDHAIAVFGARSQYASESIFNVIGQNPTNPAAGAAALDQLDKALKTIGGRGLGPIAPGAAATLGGGNTSSQGTKGRRSLAAAMALPINKGKSEAEVSKHLSDLGYTVVRP
jgi:hypothetical protein